MTAYNREKYIAEAIESVLAQTFTDFELIIFDDSSKDRTVEIARRYENDRRVCVHVNTPRLGQFPNRNRAAALAKGKYLKYVDSDDLIYPHCLQVMTHYMEAYPGAGVGICQSLQTDVPFPIQFQPRGAWGQSLSGAGMPTHTRSTAPSRL